MVEPAALPVEVRDSGDLRLLQALAAKTAELLVTGDEDLLALREQYAIETPAEFVKRL